MRAMRDPKVSGFIKFLVRSNNYRQCFYTISSLNGAPRVWAEKIYFGHKILMKQLHDCSY